MKIVENSRNRLALRSSSPVLGGVICLLGLLILGGGTIDILDNRGEGGGWFAAPVGLAFAALGLVLLLSPVEYVIDRSTEQILHLRRGPWERVLRRIPVPGLSAARVAKERIRTNRGGFTAYSILLDHADMAPFRLGPHRKRRQKQDSLAATVNEWLNTL